MRLCAWFTFALVLCLHGTTARAQRLQLPSRLPQNSDPYKPVQFAPNTSAPSAGYLPATATPGGSAPVYNSAPPAATFNGNIQPFDPYAVSSGTGYLPPSSAPSFAQPNIVQPPYTAAPNTAPGFVSPPSQFNGGVAQPNFTPTPGYGGPAAIYPETAPTIFPPGYTGPLQSWGSVTRLLQEVRFQGEWVMGGDGPDELGITSSEVSATLAIPLFQLQTPFLVTPGFALHLFNGPESLGPGTADLPGQTYDAWLDVGFNPQITNWFGAELGVRIGAYTDFDTISDDSIRIMGRGLGVVKLSPTWTAKAGLIYIDRLDVKLLPAGGLVWDPSPDRHFEFIFPRPKLARRLTTLANHNVWGYASGEYGGGSWTIVRDNDLRDQFDYNDLRVMLGVEFIPEANSGMSGFFEAGYAFERELIYRSGSPAVLELDDTFLLRGGIAF